VKDNSKKSIKFVMSDKCPRKLRGIPIKPCSLAIKRLHNQGGGCEWFVDDPKAKYCFWYYLHLHPSEVHTVTAISKLWSTSVNNVSIAERSAHAKMIKQLKPSDE